MPAFVILHHQMPVHHERNSHWDVMFQVDNVLRTWALAEAPDQNADIEATQLPDHRLEYLEYEGPISGDRGQVVQWDRGSYLLLATDESQYLVDLTGKRLSGRVQLRRIADQRWLFSFTGITAAT